MCSRLLLCLCTAEISTVLCDKPEKAQQLLEQAEKIPHLKRIIMMDPVSNNNTLLAEKHHIKLYSFAEVEVNKANIFSGLVNQVPRLFVCITGED